MDTIKIDKKNTKLVAHRGLSGLECENTCAAFIAAANRSYWGIETDVHATADGNYIVMHDADSGHRVSDTSVIVSECTLPEIQSVLLKNPRTGEVRNDYRIPTLQEYISICKRYDKVAVAELKTDFTEEQIAEIIQIIEGMDHLQNTVFISFCWENLLKIKKLRPDQPVQFLCWEIDDAKLEELAENKMDLDICRTGISEALVKKVHEKGLKINSWTIDTSEEAQRDIAWGTDFITTNILE